ANRRIPVDGKRFDRGACKSGARDRIAPHHPAGRRSHKTAPASIWYAATDIGGAPNASTFLSGSFFNAIAISTWADHRKLRSYTTLRYRFSDPCEPKKHLKAPARYTRPREHRNTSHSVGRKYRAAFHSRRSVRGANHAHDSLDSAD